MNNVTLYLASQSPRRSELLTQIGFMFETCVPNVVERQLPHECARDYVLRLAVSKAKAGVSLQDPNIDDAFIVLGADTVVVFNNEVLEKPKNKADSRRMLSLLSGQEHTVMTAIAVANKTNFMSDIVLTNVNFRDISVSEMNDYWLTGEPSDKAGSYAIQGIAGKFVHHICGNYSAVVGLPLMHTERLINQFNAKYYGV